MADWSNIEFGKRLRVCRAQDFLPILADAITVWDFFACLICAETALHVVGYSQWRPESSLLLPRWMSHAWLWESSAVALALRDPALTNPSREVFAGQLIWGGEKRCALAFALLITMTTLFRCNIDITGIWLPCWGGIFAIFVAGSRWMVGACLEGLQRSGALREAVALIGADGPRGRLTRLIGSGADVVGVFNALPLGQMSESDIERLLDLGRVGALDTVLVAAENEAPSELALLIERLKVMPVEVVVSAGTKLQENPTSDLRILGNIQVAVVADCPIKRRDLLVKTSLDKAGALVILLLLAPLILAIAVAVGLTSEGKIIFKQTRQGWCGKSFTLWKFRTMHEPPDGSGWTRQTERNDARCTRVGRILRRTSLDELPQLWNVLCGEMSLVGPRPHADYLHRIDQVGREIMAVYAQRNRVKPGITGWAQIHGARGATENIEQLWQRLRYDLYYIENWSLWLDLQILVRTVFCLFGENAY